MTPRATAGFDKERVGVRVQVQYVPKQVLNVGVRKQRHEHGGQVVAIVVQRNDLVRMEDTVAVTVAVWIQDLVQNTAASLMVHHVLKVEAVHGNDSVDGVTGLHGCCCVERIGFQ